MKCKNCAAYRGPLAGGNRAVCRGVKNPNTEHYCPAGEMEHNQQGKGKR